MNLDKTITLTVSFEEYCVIAIALQDRMEKLSSPALIEETQKVFIKVQNQLIS